jgi:hypothetical protein
MASGQTNGENSPASPEASPLDTSRPGVRTGSTLQWFAIFNPNISHGEDSAHENVLWFHPPNWHQDQQLNAVGLCTAFACLKSVFDSGDVNTICASGTRTTMVPVEPDFWYSVGFSRVDDDSLPDDRDDGTAHAAESVIRIGHATFGMGSGTLTKCLADLMREVTEAEREDAAKEQRPMKKEKHLRPVAARRLRGMLLSHAVDVTASLQAAVSSYRGSMGVRHGVEYLSVDHVGHLHASSFARRLHNAHPGTIAHSVLVLANKVAFTTLNHVTTATLLSFIAKAEAERRRSAEGLRPEAVFLIRRGKVIGVRGDALNALRIGPAGQALPPVLKDHEPSPNRGLLERVAAMLGNPSPSADLSTATLIDTAGNYAVCAHNAKTRCFIDDREMGLLCFRQGDFSLYCLLDSKFCGHELLRAGITDSVAAILIEEAANLDVAQSVAQAMMSKTRPLENTVVFAYHNEANLAWKTSAHVKADDTSGRSELVELLDRLRQSSLVRADSSSLAARVADTAWAFMERREERSFAFAFGAANFEDAWANADQVRKIALVGQLVE